MKTNGMKKQTITLDSLGKTMQKNSADGEKLKNKLSFTIDKNSVALFYHTVKGKQNQRFCDWYLPQVQNLRTNYWFWRFKMVFCPK